MADSTFIVPDGSNNNGGWLGNGNGWGGGILGFLLGLMFGNGGFGNGFGGWGGGNNAGTAYLGNMINNDNGRDLLMQAINNNGEASRAAVQNLATMIGQDFNLVNSGVQTITQALNNIANSQGLNFAQTINAIQNGNSAVQAQFSQCCCQMQNAINQQTNTLQNGANMNTQAILGKLGEMQTQALQDKLDAARAENTRLAGEISQQQQNNVIAGMISNAINPLVAQLAGIRSEVDAIKRCQPATVTLPNNSMTAVPTIWANAVADNFVDRVAAALTPTTTTTPTT